MLFGTYYRFIKYIIDDMAWLRRILGICKKTQKKKKTVEGNQVTVKHRQVFHFDNGRTCLCLLPQSRRRAAAAGEPQAYLPQGCRLEVPSLPCLADFRPTVIHDKL